MRKKLENGGKKFANCCLRIGAGASALPLMLAGVGVAIAGVFAALPLLVPGIIAGVAVGIKTNNLNKGVDAYESVTFSVCSLGKKMIEAGIKAGSYALKGNAASEKISVGKEPVGVARTAADPARDSEPDPDPENNSSMGYS